jgi:RNA polymerase sigma-70 factor, ECF subfamily
MPSDSISNFEPEDRAAEFLRLLNQHERALNAYIFTLNPHWADAEDIAQETRLRLWKQFDKFQPGTDFCAWARSIAYYLVLKHRLKASRDRLRFGKSFYESVSVAIAARPELVVARQEALTRCMEKLDEAKRALIESHYSDEQSLRELAERAGRSYDALRKAVYRTHLVLADCIRLELQKKKVDE